MTLKKLRRYDIVKPLGKGAMGVVYEGYDPTIGRRVAIKTIRIDHLSDSVVTEFEARFRSEARAAGRLHHPNIVAVYDADRDEGTAFMVMELVQGVDLKEQLDAGQLPGFQRTLAIMHDLLAALGFAHEQGIIHRDIKPANMMLDQHGRVKLTDFGVARIADSGEATRTQGSIVGTLKYMSPEQLQGLGVDARTDLYAAGIVLYQLLTGVRPFDGPTDFAIMQKIATENPPPPSSLNPALPVEIDALLGKALSKRKEDRYASAREFSAALQAFSATSAGDPSGTRTVIRPLSAAPQPGLPTGADSLPGTMVAQEMELLYWKDIQNSDEIEDFQGFLKQFPSGVYAGLARRRLRRLQGLPADGSGSSGSGSAVHGSLPLAEQMAETLIIPRAQPPAADGGEEATRLVPKNPAPAGAVEAADDGAAGAGTPAAAAAGPGTENAAGEPTRTAIVARSADASGPAPGSDDATRVVAPKPPAASDLAAASAAASAVPIEKQAEKTATDAGKPAGLPPAPTAVPVPAPPPAAATPRRSPVVVAGALAALAALGGGWYAMTRSPAPPAAPAPASEVAAAPTTAPPPAPPASAVAEPTVPPPAPSALEQARALESSAAGGAVMAYEALAAGPDTALAAQAARRLWELHRDGMAGLNADATIAQRWYEQAKKRGAELPDWAPPAPVAVGKPAPPAVVEKPAAPKPAPPVVAEKPAAPKPAPVVAEKPAAPKPAPVVASDEPARKSEPAAKPPAAPAPTPAPVPAPKPGEQRPPVAEPAYKDPAPAEVARPPAEASKPDRASEQYAIGQRLEKTNLRIAKDAYRRAAGLGNGLAMKRLWELQKDGDAEARAEAHRWHQEAWALKVPGVPEPSGKAP